MFGLLIIIVCKISPILVYEFTTSHGRKEDGEGEEEGKREGKGERRRARGSGEGKEGRR